MRWKGRRQSQNIEDRRGQGGRLRLPGGFGRSRGAPRMRRAGGGSIGMMIVIVVVLWILGINPIELLSGGGLAPQGGGSATSQRSAPGTPAADDAMRGFVATVLAETEDTWSKIFQAGGQPYSEPTLVLFSGGVRSACGQASAATGPFYCPGDRKIYIDLAF
ncbi:MAG: neutral zinc metallopeptidase, partial [Alphaproteobacteria bacterium]